MYVCREGGTLDSSSFFVFLSGWLAGRPAGLLDVMDGFLSSQADQREGPFRPNDSI